MAKKSTGSPYEDADVPVGTVLAQLRRRARITGQSLGRRVGMSQAKISKIETGAMVPLARDVERLARALGASQAHIDRLVEQAAQTRDQMADLRLNPRRHDLGAWQRMLGQLEAGASEFRTFHPTVIGALLQTSEYARGVLSTTHKWWSNAGDVAPVAVAEVVSARMRRQEVLEDTGKHFHFVITETLLRHLVGRTEDMSAQLSRLREVSRQDNVTVSMITEETPWPIPPLHGFSILDDRCVFIDLFNTTMVSRGHYDLRLYRQAFDTLQAHATREIEPILDKYRRRYLKLAQED
jgi:transcriptional regulator with XRE-family HTH domain